MNKNAYDLLFCTFVNVLPVLTNVHYIHAVESNIIKYANRRVLRGLIRMQSSHFANIFSHEIMEFRG